MHDGFYTVSFETPLSSGRGVVLLRDGILRGGDSTSYYLGKYRAEGDAVTAELTANRHADCRAAATSLFVLDSVKIKLSGRFSGPTASLTGKAAELPGLIFRAALIRIGA